MPIGREAIADGENVVLEEFGSWVPSSIGEAKQRGELVLVAEDNVIN